ncbi:MAG: hypothetical protein NT038_07330 [Euryarchaeota archaeon]|nr:hypothetical protein [Euryarchaeota archaeon]
MGGIISCVDIESDHRCAGMAETIGPCGIQSEWNHAPYHNRKRGSAGQSET